jgi:hypothetical protein
VEDLCCARIVWSRKCDHICQIPIGSIHNSDRQIWRATINGEFIARSVYHLHKELLATDQWESSHTSQHKIMWKTIWKMNVPRVVKVFIWRTCHNALATKTNLFSMQNH